MQSGAVDCSGIDQVDRVGELRSLFHSFQNAFIEVRLHDAGAQITATATLQQVLQGKWPKVKGECGAGVLGESDIVQLSKGRPPVNINIGIWIVNLSYLDQLFLEQLLNLQARPVFRLMHQGCVDYAEVELLLQQAATGDFAAHRVRGHGLAQTL
ncbi:hypothetical protein D3C72_1513080 [compost metagenome]